MGTNHPQHHSRRCSPLQHSGPFAFTDCRKSFPGSHLSARLYMLSSRDSVVGRAHAPRASGVRHLSLRRSTRAAHPFGSSRGTRSGHPGEVPIIGKPRYSRPSCSRSSLRRGKNRIEIVSIQARYNPFSAASVVISPGVDEYQMVRRHTPRCASVEEEKRR